MKSKKKKTAKKIVLPEKYRNPIGFSVILLGFYFFISFVSYLSTWKQDLSILNVDLEEQLEDANLVAQNAGAKVGASLGNYFIHDWFGIASFIFVFLLVIIGLRFLKVKTLPLSKTIKYSIPAIIWFSVLFSMLFDNTDYLAGGMHGYNISKYLKTLIGTVGAYMVLLVFLVTYMYFLFEEQVTKLFKTVSNPSELKLRLSVPEKAKVVEEEEEFEVGFQEETAFEKDGINVPVNIDTNEIPSKDDIESFELEVAADVAMETVVAPREQEIIPAPQPPAINSEHIQPEVEFESLPANNVDVENAESVQAQLAKEAEEELQQAETSVEEDNFDVVKNQEEQLEELPDYDPKLDLSNYRFPGIDILEDYDNSDTSVTQEELIENKNRIIDTLENYNIKISKIKATVGPTITLYEIVPAPGVRISKIKNLEDDIALSLAALGIRIVAPMPGKGTIGIEVPNHKPEIVSMRSVIASRNFQESEAALPLALGKTISNETFVVDLAKLPHLLVAGATGQGKSVGLNAIMASLLYKKHPAELKFVLVDPKKVELTLYSRIEKHFLAKLPDEEEAIITDTQKVVHTLNSLCIEMDERYELLKAAHARNLKEYNAKFTKRKLNPEKGHRFLPYIVVIIDEFADLIMTAGKEVETPLARIAQLARAVGIHLIIATQRPTTNIITGVIKANFPARMAFRVTASIDSRTILDSTGANQLIGRGDMLVSTGSDLQRVQCAFIDTPEIETLTDHICEQQSYSSALLLPDFDDGNGADEVIDLDIKDSLFEEAARLVVAHQQGSTSFIQRKMSIGYNRAGRIMDQLEAAGVVGPSQGSKARDVLFADEVSLLNHLNTI